MKTAAFALTILLSGAAFAQSADAPAYAGDGLSTAAFETEGAVAGAGPTETSASAAIVLPGNSSPERDARGIAVLSHPAVVPPGWNGTAATAMGGPELDPATGEEIGADETYPACTATVTDNCLQTYEVS